MGDPAGYNTPAKFNRYIYSGFPEKEISDPRYCVRFARNPEDIDTALKLRFEVFNLELGEGLDSSYATQRDEDEFDAQCHHLIVIEKQNKRVIATYRMQTRQMAKGGKGFYSQGEFDLSRFPSEVLEQSVEVGRACIAREHRNGRVLFLLWKGIARYMEHTQKRYLFGCCSLTSQDADEGKAVMDYLERNGYTHRSIRVPPLSEVECYPTDFTVSRPVKVKIPILFRLYLNYNAKVCGPPAIDRAFKTIDYLVIMDIAELDVRTRKMFF
jgi:putative hemolysin